MRKEFEGMHVTNSEGVNNKFYSLEFTTYKYEQKPFSVLIDNIYSLVVCGKIKTASLTLKGLYNYINVTLHQ